MNFGFLLGGEIASAPLSRNINTKLVAWGRMNFADLSPYPGGDLIRQGLDHLAHGMQSEAALLVQIGAPRLRRLGFDISDLNDGPPEHKLYELLSSSDPDSAHSRYNALIRRLVSFERAVECAG